MNKSTIRLRQKRTEAKKNGLKFFQYRNFSYALKKAKSLSKSEIFRSRKKILLIEKKNN